MLADAAHLARLRIAERRIEIVDSKMAHLKQKVDSALIGHRIGGSEQLRLAIDQADHHLRIAMQCLEKLKTANDSSFDRHYATLDDALDDLSQSIRSAVSRCP